MPEVQGMRTEATKCSRRVGEWEVQRKSSVCTRGTDGAGMRCCALLVAATQHGAGCDVQFVKESGAGRRREPGAMEQRCGRSLRCSLISLVRCGGGARPWVAHPSAECRLLRLRRVAFVVELHSSSTQVPNGKNKTADEDAERSCN